jgi:hypothetical protein
VDPTSLSELGGDTMASYDIRGDAERAALAREGPYSGLRGEGLLGFAGLMLALAGLFNLIEGLLAIGDSRVFVADSTFVFSDLNRWGWIVLLLGVLQLLAAGGIASGSEWARWFGIAVASLNLIGQLFFMSAYPLWGVTMVAIDIVIIYALAMYAGKRSRPAV